MEKHIGFNNLEMFKKLNILPLASEILLQENSNTELRSYFGCPIGFLPEPINE